MPNIYFLKRHTCYWGDFNIVKATCEGIKEIVKSGINFDYAILLSGQDYLIKSTTQIETICTGCGLAFHDADAQFCKRCGTKLGDGGNGITSVTG